jgi:alpha 1,2-mannosyltransferase
VYLNINPDLIVKSFELWSTLSSVNMTAIRLSLVTYLEERVQAGELSANGGFGEKWRSARSRTDENAPVRPNGRGLGEAPSQFLLLGDKTEREHRCLVFTAGNADTFSRVLLTLKILRKHHNCELIAEVFHFPEEAPAADDPVRDELAAVNATLIELPGVGKSKSRTKNVSALTLSLFLQ